MLRVVIDSNVYVSALISPTSTAASAVDAWRIRGAYEVVISEQLIIELEDVVRREKFRSYFSEKQGMEMVEKLRHGTTISREGAVKRVSPDPRDDYLIALAISSNADYLVTGDGKHLLSLEPGEHPPIITPRALLEKIKQE